MQSKKRILVVMLLVLATLVSAGAIISHLSPSQKCVLKVSPPPSVGAARPIVADNPYLIADIVEQASPATVFISVEWPCRAGAKTDRPAGSFSFF